MAVLEQTIRELAQTLGEKLQQKAAKLAIAESCTGGWIAKIITDVPGSSAWFEASIVSYSNASKQSLLKVTGAVLDEFGAVSGETVRAMVDGVFEKTAANYAASVSGIAGPSGGSKEKPVGTVWIAYGIRDQDTTTRQYFFEGDREAVRLQSAQVVIEALIELVQ